MTSMTDQEFAQTEVLLRQRLAQLATHAPTAVHLPGEVPVVAFDRRAGRGRRAGMITAIAALIGAGGFTTYSFIGASNDGGAATPQEAVTTFVSAMEREDVLGMIDVTLPQEVSALRGAIDSITSDAKRIGILAEDFDTSGVQGIDIAVDDLVLDTNFLEGGLAAVTATSGTVSTSFDTANLRLGDTLRQLLGDDQTVDTAVTDFSGIGPQAVLMTVEQHGRWYLSLEYTIAEYVRKAAGWEVPGPVSRAPVGFDSPEAAATGFYDRFASLDLQSAIDTFAPGEDAVAWLAQAWMAEAQAAIDRGRTDGWSVAITGLTFETIGDGDQRMMRPLTFTVQGTMPAGLDEDSTDVEPTEPQPFTIERADGCTTVTGSLAESMFGPEASPVATRVEGGYQLCGTGNEILGGLTLFFAGSALQLPAVSVVQDDGLWYVSPLGTVLGSAAITLHDVADGSSLFDTTLAPYFYGGWSRASLESVVTGQTVDAIDPACLAALTVEDGVVTGVVSDPSTEAVQACAETVFYSSGDFQSGSEEAPPVVEVVGPASTVADAP